AGPGAAELAGVEAGPRLLVRAPVRPELVIFLALGRIAEDFIGLVDLLELVLGRLVAGIDVRVVLARQLPVRLLELLVRGGFRDAERGVIVFEVHRQSNPSIRLNSSSSSARRRRVSRADSPSSRMSGRSRSTTSAIDISRCTPARLMPPSPTSRLIAFSRSSSSREYRRRLPIVRDGCTSPSRSYLRSVWGCMPSIRAATLMK